MFFIVSLNHHIVKFKALLLIVGLAVCREFVWLFLLLVEHFNRVCIFSVGNSCRIISVSLIYVNDIYWFYILLGKFSWILAWCCMAMEFYLVYLAFVM